MLENSNLTYTLTGPHHHDYVQMLPPPHRLPSHHQPPRRKKPRPGQAQPFHPAPEAPRLPRLCAISSCIHCRRQHVTDPLPPPSPPVGTQKGPALSPSRPPNVVIRRARVAPHHRKRRWNCSRHGCTTHNCQMSFVRLYLYPVRCGRTVGWWWVAAHDDARGQNRPRSPSFWPLHVGECFLPVCMAPGPTVGPDLQDSSRSRTDGTGSNRYLLRCCQRCGAAPGGRCQSDLGYNVAWSSPWSWCVPSSHTKKHTHNIASETPHSQSHTTTAGCDEGNTAYGGFAQQHAWFLPAPPPPPET